MSYFPTGYDESPCTQNPNDPVCQALHPSSPPTGTSSITGLPYSSIPSTPGAPNMMGTRGPSAGLPIPLLAVAVVGAIAVMMLRQPKTNPRRRRRSRR